MRHAPSGEVRIGWVPCASGDRPAFDAGLAWIVESGHRLIANKTTAEAPARAPAVSSAVGGRHHELQRTR